jgi:prevent-host-death family protein
MNINQDIRPITYLKMRAAAVLDQINYTHRPIIITQDGEPRAVLQDAESYERMKKAIALMKLLAQGEADVRKGRVIQQEKVFTALKTKLNKKRNAKS